MKKIIFCCSFIFIAAISFANDNDSLQKQQSFLFISDIHLSTTTLHTTYGEDTGMDLWKRFLAKVDSLLSAEKSLQFIVCTGDLPEHYNCKPPCYLPDSSRTNHNKNIATVLEGLKRLSKKHHKPLFYVPGNNDPLAGDYYSFADEKQQTPLSLVEGINSKKIISNPNPTMGFYAAKPVKGLRLISLNTIIYSKKFIPVDGTNQQTDGDKQLNWLAQQLAEAETKKEKVYIAMHIPPGYDAYSSKPMWAQSSTSNNYWVNKFLSLTTRYQKNIETILFGHTHMEELRMLYDSTGVNVTTLAISSPGVTPQHNNNPGFKIVYYNKKDKALTNFTTYYTLPVQQFWGDSSYNFNQTFNKPASTSIIQYLKNNSLHTISASLENIYTVKNGNPSYKIENGIQVKYEK
jgi:3',5'-cyclic AMP phosphodiesterase CpdA